MTKWFFISIVWTVLTAEATSVKFLPTHSGFMMDEACVVKLGAKNIDPLLDGMLKTGKSCLRALNGSGSKKNLEGLEVLLANIENPPKIVCSQTDYPWSSSSRAHATTPLNDKHPLISLNPNSLEKGDTPELRATLFHELFHNLGYLHYQDVEYPYACSTCCFPDENATTEGIRLACTICQGAYKTVDDPGYASAVAAFFSADNQSERSVPSLEYQLSRHPNDREARFALAKYAGEYELYFATAFAEQLAIRYFDLTKEEKILMSEFSAYGAPLEELPAARALARAYLSALDEDRESCDANLLLFKKTAPSVKDSYEDFPEIGALWRRYEVLTHWAYGHFLVKTDEARQRKTETPRAPIRISKLSEK